MRYIKVSIFCFFLFCLVATVTFPAFAAEATPVFQTDFENVTKIDSNTLNLSIDHWVEFGDYDGSSNGDGARIWVDGTRGKNGSKSLGLEVSDITKSRRAEFDLYPYSLTGDELTVTQWLYLPADFGLHAPGIDWNWYDFVVLYSEYIKGQSDHYLGLSLTQPDISKSEFQLTLGGRRPPNSTKYSLNKRNTFNLPRGRWFQVRSYLKRDLTNGAAKVWIDEQLVFEQSGMSTKGAQQNFHITPAKVYYETTDTTLHQMWIDDLKIYKGYVPPTVLVSPTPSLVPSPTPTITPVATPSPTFCNADINQDGSINLLDFSLLSKNLLKTSFDPARADINSDGKVNLIDYSILSSQFLKKC